MTPEQRNLLKYVGLAIAAFLIGCATALVPQLMDASQPPLNWRIVLGTGIAALVTAYGGSLLPRVGGEHIASRVDALRDEGYHRDELTVVPKADVPHLRSYNVRHGMGGHVAFLTTANPLLDQEMPADSALHVYNRLPFGYGPPYKCDSCGEPLAHVEAIDREWIAI